MADQKDVTALGQGGARVTTSKSGRVVVRDAKGAIVRTAGNRQARLDWLLNVKIPALEARLKKAKKAAKEIQKGLDNGEYPESLDV